MASDWGHQHCRDPLFSGTQWCSQTSSAKGPIELVCWLREVASLSLDRTVLSVAYDLSPVWTDVRTSYGRTSSGQIWWTALPCGFDCRFFLQQWESWTCWQLDARFHPDSDEPGLLQFQLCTCHKPIPEFCLDRSIPELDPRIVHSSIVQMLPVPHLPTFRVMPSLSGGREALICWPG